MCEKCYEFSNSMAKRNIKHPQFGISNGDFALDEYFLGTQTTAWAKAKECGHKLYSAENAFGSNKVIYC